MKLSLELAEKIIIEVQKVLKENVIVVGEDGIIMASTDPARIGTFHEGASIVVKTGKKLEIHKDDVKRLKGVKQGVNLPIRFNNEVIGVIGITGVPKEVAPHGDLLRRMTELLIQENYIREQMDWQQRSLEAYVLDWLKMKKWSNAMIQRGEILGINLNVPRRCVLIHLQDDEELLQELEQNLWLFLQRFVNQTNADDILVRWGSNRFVILQEVNLHENSASVYYRLKKLRELVESSFQLQIAIGVGSPARANNVYESYEQAERALPTAIEKNTIVFESDLRFEICLQDISEETRSLFLERTIEPLLEDKELIETLTVYIECNTSLKQAAEKLHIHINTLHYRLKRIEEITKLNPKQFKDMVTLYLALLFLEDRTK